MQEGTHPACKGTNCGSTDGRSHSDECRAEHDATVYAAALADHVQKYGPKQIARELVATALGHAYYGNALYVAKDIPVLTDEERWVIYRWLDGSQCGTDHVELQHIANKIAADA